MDVGKGASGSGVADPDQVSDAIVVDINARNRVGVWVVRSWEIELTV